MKIPNVKWDPAFADFDKAMTHLPATGWDLAVDVYQREDDTLLVKVNMPGINKSNIDVSVKDGSTLVVKGSRQEEKAIEQKDYFCKEIKKGEFERYIYLPYTVQKDKMNMNYKDGILTVELFKKPQTGSKQKIEVHIK